MFCKGRVQSCVSVTFLQAQAFILLGFIVILMCRIEMCKQVSTVTINI